MGHTERLEVIGGLYEATAEVIAARNKAEVFAAFREARDQGFRLTLAGARRSFGEQYLPPSGAKVLDASELEHSATVIETEPDGSIWVRASGSITLRELGVAFPGHRVSCPPTTDTITIAGALSACTHNSASYFAEAVRAFVVLTPRGDELYCRADGSPLERELFEHGPGSFGAFGVITDIELRLRPHDPNRWILVHSLFAGPSRDGSYLDRMEEAADNPRFGEGAGAVVYGNRGHAIVFADELLPPGERPRAPQALLTGEDITWQAMTQSIVQRFPRLAEWIVSKAYPQGIARFAPLHGFLYFQRGFDEAHRRMSKGGASKALLRAFGARNRLPIRHTAWFFPRAELRAFMEGYFSILDRYPGIEAVAEQQDLVLLGASRFPCHTMGRTQEPIGALTASFAVDQDGPIEKRVREFFLEVTTRCPEFSPGARVSLCKQIHADEATLRGMHVDFASAVQRLRAEVDPDKILTSRMLTALGVK
jgi:hypothetical protein